MSFFMVFLCFTSGEGQAAKCQPAYPRHYTSAAECEAFSQNDAFLKTYVKSVRNGQYQSGSSVEIVCMEKTVPAPEPAH